MRSAAFVLPAFLLPAFLLVAACGGKEGTGNNSADADVPPPAAQEQTDLNLTMDGQNSVVPIALPSPAPLAALPPAYAGRWGLTAEDCAGKGDAEGLLTVAGSTLTGSGIGGTLDRVTAASPGRVTAMTTGATAHAVSLTLVDDGRTLVVDERDTAASHRYVRCPAT